MISAQDALQQLQDGNRRYVADERAHRPHTLQTRRGDLVAGQNPVAVVLGCSDSRVPVEVVFDQCLGDLFVIRVAGNIAAPSQVGSVEYAAAVLGTRLVVVLGHSHCGAVTATVEELERPATDRSPNLGAIVDRIRPAVESVVAAGGDDHDDLVARAIRANVRVTAERLRHGSEIIESLVEKGDLMIVGAEYSLETGEVVFLD